MRNPKINLTGRRFNYLTVIAYSHLGKTKGGVDAFMWKCKCDCGSCVVLNGAYIRSGNTKSCGCIKIPSIKKAKTTHGKTKTPEYRSWVSAKLRCTNPMDGRFHSYGGRGIKMCERWMKFENFFLDMGKRPDGFSLERIDVNGDYSPENCKWASWGDQMDNMRKNIIVNLNGISSTCMRKACIKLGLKYKSVHQWMKRNGSSAHDAINEFIKRQNG